MRCFIAIPLSSQSHKELAQIQLNLKETDSDVKWVKSENIHLTLKFLGDIEETKIATISQKLQEVVKIHNYFEILVGKLGTFPNLLNPRVIWIGINKNEDKINNLQKNTEEALTPLGLEKEMRAFHPHLTLGRVRSKKNIKQLTEKIKTLQLPQFQPITVNKIVLFQSILKPSGAEYTVLEEFKLSGK